MSHSTRQVETFSKRVSKRSRWLSCRSNSRKSFLPCCQTRAIMQSGAARPGQEYEWSGQDKNMQDAYDWEKQQ